jgi:RHS repeat-associated protein
MKVFQCTGLNLMMAALALLSSLNSVNAQAMGGRESGEMAPTEIKAGQVKDGSVSGSVNLFTGTYATSASLGSVSTPSGLSFNLSMSYSSVKSTGTNVPHSTGIPYGEGWSLDLPHISVSTTSYRNFTRQLELGQVMEYPQVFAGNGPDLDPTEAFKAYEHAYGTYYSINQEGSLYWFAPELVIPGYASGRLIYKNFDASSNEAVFTLHKFESYVEARFNGQLWRVILDNGTIYEFNVQQYINTNSTNDRLTQEQAEFTDNMGNELLSPSVQDKKDDIKQMYLPKSGISTWFVRSITNNNSLDRIQFKYKTLGKIDYYKEYADLATKTAIYNSLYQEVVPGTNCSPFNPAGIQTIGLFQGSGWRELPDAYTDILLEEVLSSNSGKIVLEYESIYPTNGSQLLSLADPAVGRLDSLYSFKTIYKWGGANQFNGWRRYRHSYSAEILGHSRLHISSSNPYMASVAISGIGSGCGVNVNNPPYFYFPESIQNGLGNINFDHSFLESERLNSSRLDMPGGDLYELKTTLKQAVSSNPAYCNFDVKLVTGKKTLSYGWAELWQIPAALEGGSNQLASSVQAVLWGTAMSIPANNIGGQRQAVFQRCIEQEREEVIFSTSGTPFKWNTATSHPLYGEVIGSKNTSNFFKFEELPLNFEGFHIQVGPANADVQYDYNEFQITLGENALAVNPSGQTVDINHAYDPPYIMDGNNWRKFMPISSSFGVGLPWSPVKELHKHSWAYLVGNHAQNFWYNRYIETGLNNTFAQLPGYANKPTLADENTSLESVELVRYAKNPYMLKRVVTYIRNGGHLDPDGGFKEVATIELGYEVLQVDKLLNYHYLNNDPAQITDFNPLVSPIKRNVFVLKHIKQLPRDYVPNANVEVPTTTFEYLVTDIALPNGSPFTSFQNLITKITTSVGKSTIITYASNYRHPTMKIDPRPGSYYCNDGPCVEIRKRGQEAWSVFYTVDEIIEVDEHFTNTSTATRKWDYDFSGMVTKNFVTPLADNYQYDKQYKLSSGYEYCTVTGPVADLTTNARPETSYKHAVDPLLWGKLLEMETKDHLSNLISKSKYTYETVEAFVAAHLKPSGITYDYEFQRNASYSNYDPNCVVTALPFNHQVPSQVPLSSSTPARHWMLYMAWRIQSLDPILMPNYHNSPWSMGSTSINNGIVNALHNVYAQNITVQQWVLAWKAYYQAQSLYNATITAACPQVPNHKTIDIQIPGAYGGPKFYEATMHDFIETEWAARGYSHKYSSSYFIKLTKSEHFEYDKDYNNPSSYTSLMTTTEYEYFDADKDGNGTCSGYWEFFGDPRPMNSNYVAAPAGKYPLFKEPSWQLHSKKSYSNEYPGHYNLVEYYYLYDFLNHPNSIDLSGSAPDFLSEDMSGATAAQHIFYLSEKYGIRNVVLEQKSTVVDAEELPYSNSTYYIYDTDWTSLELPVQTGYVPDPNNPNASPGPLPPCNGPITPPGGGGSGGGPGGNGNGGLPTTDPCIIGMIQPIGVLDSYQLYGGVNMSIVNSNSGNPILYGPNTPGDGCDPIMMNGNPDYSHFVLEDDNGNSVWYMYALDRRPRPIIALREVKNQLVPVDETFRQNLNSTVGLLGQSCKTVIPEYNWQEITNNASPDPRALIVYNFPFPVASQNNNTPFDFTPKTVYKVLQRNNYGQVVLEEDIDGIKTKYDYFPILDHGFFTCQPTTLSSTGYGLILQRNNIIKHPGLVKKATYAYGSSMPLYREYSYDNYNAVVSLKDVNNRELTFEYDEYGRISKAFDNGDLIKEFTYHRWENDHSLTFGQRAMQNYVEATLFLDDNGHTITSRTFADPLGRDRLSTAWTSSNPNEILVSGGIVRDGWDRPLKSYKPYVFTQPVTNVNYSMFSVPATNLGFVQFDYEDSHRARLKELALPGHNIGDTKNASTTYGIIDGLSLATQELGLNANALQQVGFNLNTNYKFFVSKSKDQDGKETWSYSDALGRVVAVKKEDNGNKVVTLSKYNSRGQLVQSIDPNGLSTHYFYNYLGRLYAKSTPDAGVTKYLYDISGKLLAEQDENAQQEGYIRVLQYDWLNRPASQARVYWGQSGPAAVFSNYEDLNSTSLFNENWEDTWFAGVVLEKKMFYDGEIPSFVFNASKPEVLNYLTNSRGHMVGRLTTTVVYNESGAPMEFRHQSYTEKGWSKWLITQFNPNGIKPNAKGIDYRIDYRDFNRIGTPSMLVVDLDNDTRVDFRYHYDYDDWNRLEVVSVSYETNKQHGYKLVEYQYDDARGVVKQMNYYDNVDMNCPDRLVDEVKFTFDQRDRLIDISSQLFDWELFYDSNLPNLPGLDATKNWNGNINASIATYKLSATTNNPGNFNGPTVYGYTYDDLDRLVKADAAILPGSFSPGLNVSSMLDGDASYSYDKAGNLLSLSRKEIGQPATTDYDYRYSPNTNRLKEIMAHVPGPGGSVTQVLDRSYSYDLNGNLTGDTKRGITGVLYNRANLPHKISTDNSEITYLYGMADNRIYKQVQSKKGTGLSTAEYYIRDAGERELGVLNINKNAVTWYLHGTDRFAHTEHPLQAPNQAGAFGSIVFDNDDDIAVGDGKNQEKKGAVEDLKDSNDSLQFPDKLYYYADSTLNLLGYKLESQWSAADSSLHILEVFDLYDANQVLVFTDADGKELYLSILKVLGMDSDDLLGWTPVQPIDPYSLPYTYVLGPVVPDVVFYIKDHLGNTRVTYNPEVSCTEVNYTLVSVHDYFPYGKELRGYHASDPERYQSTNHERDLETGLDYRGARFYDSDVARFLSLDPLAAAYAPISPYNYVLGNPLSFVDPDGRSPEGITPGGVDPSPTPKPVPPITPSPPDEIIINERAVRPRPQQTTNSSNAGSMIAGIMRFGSEDFGSSSGGTAAIPIEMSLYHTTDWSHSTERIAHGQITLHFEFDIKADEFKYTGFDASDPVTKGSIEDAVISVIEYTDGENLTVKFEVSTYRMTYTPAFNVPVMKNPEVEFGVTFSPTTIVDATAGFSQLSFSYSTYKWSGGRSLVFNPPTLMLGLNSMPIFSDAGMQSIRTRRSQGGIMWGYEKQPRWGTYQIMVEGFNENELPYRAVSIYNFRK